MNWKTFFKNNTPRFREASKLSKDVSKYKKQVASGNEVDKEIYQPLIDHLETKLEDLRNGMLEDLEEFKKEDNIPFNLLRLFITFVSDLTNPSPTYN